MYSASSAVAGGPSNCVMPIRDRLLRLDEVKQIVGLGKTLIYRLVQVGQFPQPCKPGGSATRWSENEINAWVADCSSQRLN